MKRKTVETYYAVRIGRPGRHWPYFMVGAGNTPRLFILREQAERERPKDDSYCKVVKVRLTT